MKHTPAMNKLCISLFGMMLLLSSNAQAVLPTIVSTFANATQVTINGNGFGPSVAVNLDGKRLHIQSSTTTQIVASLPFPLVQGSHSIHVANGNSGVGVVGTLSVSGIVSRIIGSDGTVLNGRGFTCTKTGVGTYVLTFPAGTFTGQTAPIPLAMPNGATVIASGVEWPADGSATVDFEFTADVPFDFLVANSL